MKTQILSLLCCLFAWLLPVQAQDSPDIRNFSWKKVADRMPDEWYGSQQARASFDKGIGCILKTQIRVDGKPTVWCAQHDEHTFAPAPARAYELASFSGAESASIVALLMSIPHPSPEIVAAVKGAVAWFETYAVKDIRVERVPDGSPKGDARVVSAPGNVLWARFYDLETGKPFFCGRDGVKHATLAEIEKERRGGYSWYTNAPQRVLDRYAKWISGI
ncbi:MULTISPECIES: pectate lyase [Mediterranea]|uniref:pectate lyase n=1 Tax=Mediterranea TaxID=1926659 RepID=UPI0020137166|nr:MULTISPECIES: pectate lyase [Mediterranea]MCL1607556.1 pectate lyase [Mediterranea sp. ET5]MDM8122637.1 pectate lyase [Mediterranea massiliensis]MDM8197379.1 pectate lyase [Mediterranea massiliensis]